MIASLIWALLGLFFCAGCAIVVWYKLFQLSNCTANNVVDFLRHVDCEKAQLLLDPANERSLCTVLPARELRKAQRHNALLYKECLNRMAHNAWVLMQLANREELRGHPLTLEFAQALQQECVAVRAYALVARTTLMFCLASGSAITLTQLREIEGISGLESYERLKAAAGNLFSRIHPDQFQEVLEAL